jgi:hypothetical protein
MVHQCDPWYMSGHVLHLCNLHRVCLFPPLASFPHFIARFPAPSPIVPPNSRLLSSLGCAHFGTFATLALSSSGFHSSVWPFGGTLGFAKTLHGAWCAQCGSESYPPVPRGQRRLRHSTWSWAIPSRIQQCRCNHQHFVHRLSSRAEVLTKYPLVADSTDVDFCKQGTILVLKQQTHLTLPSPSASSKAWPMAYRMWQY